MAAQLDILALEPFFGGARRMMLETLIRMSRHRWTLLKLPPRRMERRLSVAAQWFAEQMSRHWVGRVDLLFTSEAMNLADLVRLVPGLARVPSVVYFHENQLPPPSQAVERSIDLVNLTTGNAATELWFNSVYHTKAFFSRANALVSKHPELSANTPVPEMVKKTKLFRPPVDVSVLQEVAKGEAIRRGRKTIFVDTRDADMRLLTAALGTLVRRGQQFELITVGPVGELGELGAEVPRVTIAEADEVGQYRALLKAGVYVSVRPNAVADVKAVLAMAAGCRPIVPEAGVYLELIPKALQGYCLYEVSPDMLASRVQDLWFVEKPAEYEEEMGRAVEQFDAMRQARLMDQRLEELVVAGRR